MKLTKFAHACVLAEDEQHTALFDPGEFAWGSGKLSLTSLPKLDYVLITHEHFDHFSEPFVKAIHARFPDVMFFSTQSVVATLKGWGIEKALSLSHENVELQSLNHESMEPLSPAPQVQNVATHYKDIISHPGDSHHLTKSHDVLFLPVSGPWGATIDAIRMAVKLKPKTIVPVHDWMWNDQWRATMFDRMEAFFAESEIRFVKPVIGELFEV
jgi:L-ascorbate metabolism protein UlaG (beta-lactamase superfamily)